VGRRLADKMTTRKIFYARRSKRPIFITLALTGLCMTVFYVGFQAGRTHPDLFALRNTMPPLVIAER
jgi:hypothetical protein